MLEPMKVRKTSKCSCQQEAMDLSVHRSTDSSYDTEQGIEPPVTPSTNKNEHDVFANLKGDNIENESENEHPVAPDDIRTPKIMPEHQ